MTWFRLMGGVALMLLCEACDDSTPPITDPPTFYIRGRVSGLMQGLSQGVVLHLIDRAGAQEPIEKLTQLTDGEFRFGTAFPQGSSYEVRVAERTRGFECTVENATGTITGDVGNVVVQCNPSAIFSNFQGALAVIGQQDLTERLPNQGGGPSETTLNGPVGNAVFAGGLLYASDAGNHRVLGFDRASLESVKKESVLVLGQKDYVSRQPRAGVEGFSAPKGTSSDGSRWAVVDSGNNRVLLYDTPPSDSSKEPKVVVGQPNMASNNYGCAANSLNAPSDVLMSNGKLIVADTGNHRVLIWNSIPTENNKSANVVVGQADFNLCARNDVGSDGVGDSGPSAQTLSSPSGVWTDGTRLLVADTDNNRVLLWNTIPPSGVRTPANVVLGQPDFISNSGLTTKAGLNAPMAVTSIGGKILVAEYFNHRVTIWNQLPTQNGLPADIVLGQPNFSSNNTADPAGGTASSSRSLYYPTGMLFIAPYLVVSDTGNNRLLVFKSD